MRAFNHCILSPVDSQIKIWQCFTPFLHHYLPHHFTNGGECLMLYRLSLNHRQSWCAWVLAVWPSQFSCNFPDLRFGPSVCSCSFCRNSVSVCLFSCFFLLFPFSSCTDFTPVSLNMRVFYPSSQRLRHLFYRENRWKVSRWSFFTLSYHCCVPFLVCTTMDIFLGIFIMFCVFLVEFMKKEPSRVCRFP